MRMRRVEFTGYYFMLLPFIYAAARLIYFLLDAADIAEESSMRAALAYWTSAGAHATVMARHQAARTMLLYI